MLNLAYSSSLAKSGAKCSKLLFSLVAFNFLGKARRSTTLSAQKAVPIATKYKLFSGQVPLIFKISSKHLRNCLIKVNGPPKYKTLPAIGLPFAKPVTTCLATA